jgi:hypothetical protein
MTIFRSLWGKRPKFMRGRGNQPGEDDESYFVAIVFIGFALLFVVLFAF